MHVLHINWLIKLGIAATIIATGSRFCWERKTEIRLRPLSASTEAEIIAFGRSLLERFKLLAHHLQ